MFFHKKISSDVLLLVLLVVRLRLDSDISLLNEGSIREPESREVFLGSSSAYTQITFHSSYPHPKSVEYSEYEDAALLFNRLHYLNSVQRPYSVAYYASSPDVRNVAASSTDTGSEASGGENASGNASLPTTTEETPNELEPAISARNEELSPEDRNLIEILWKQDIDLGVSRGAYDSQKCIEVEKLKDSKENKQGIFVSCDGKLCEESECVTNPSPGLNYTVDSETGEFVLDNLPGLNEAAELLDNSTFPSFDLSLPEDDNLFPPGDLLSQMEEFIENDPGSASLYSQPEDVFPDIDDCWPESTTMLPMLSLENSHQTPFAPLPQIPEFTFQNVNPILQLSNMPSQSNEHFSNVLESSSLEANTASEAFYPVPDSLGSSIGFTLGESIATLPNDTDPIPTSSFFNTVYNSDFSELLYNQTLTTPLDELLVQNIFTDDDFQLVSSEGEQRNLTGDYFDINSDDTASLASCKVPSLSDCPDWTDSSSKSSSHTSRQNKFSHKKNIKIHQSSMTPERHRYLENEDTNNSDFSETSFEQTNEYFFVKCEYQDTYENNAAVSENHANRKFDFSSSRLPGAVNNNIPHYDHSYHLPFSSNDYYKPILREKTKSSEDESCNKDEKRAKELKIPISIDDMINLSIEEYNEMLLRYELTDQQRDLIRDIRRRGKNKVAAQNCRKRKMEQISSLQGDLDALHDEKMQLKSRQNQLLQEKDSIESKYAQLSQIVSQYTNCKPPDESNSHLVHSKPGTHPMTSNRQDDESDCKGARAKRKLKK